jgi:hypothetical protein
LFCITGSTGSSHQATNDDWDDQMKGFEKGWAAFFEVLRRYLAHFAGMKAEIASAMRGVEAPHLSQTLSKRCSTLPNVA